MATASANLLDKLRTELTANKKKAAVLGGLLLTLLIVAGRLLLSKSEPDAVAATPLVVAATPAVDPTVPKAGPVVMETHARESDASGGKAERLAGPAASGNKPPSAGDNPAKPAPGFGTPRPAQATKSPPRAVSVKDMPRSLRRDIFAASSWSAFPPEAGLASEGDDSQDASQAGPSLWQQMREAVQERRERREKDMEELAAELAELHLQSTMTGPAPTAYISGRLVHEGDTIEGFSVVRIEDKGVQLRKRGITKSLNMP